MNPSNIKKDFKRRKEKREKRKEKREKKEKKRERKKKKEREREREREEKIKNIRTYHARVIASNNRCRPQTTLLIIDSL